MDFGVGTPFHGDEILKPIYETAGALVLMFASTVSQAQTSPAMYGQHNPHGNLGVAYLYGANGMWRELSPLNYSYNRYASCAVPNHPLNENALIQDGANRNVTAPDANCLILGDVENNGEITDDTPSGFAFQEHSGHGANGNLTAPTFRAFWFDDNWLARYMATAYARPLPNGLHDNGYRIRWRQLGGDNSHWTPYLGNDHRDQVALNGIYEINNGNFAGALTHWTTLKNLSGMTYNSANQRYEYPSIGETYHLALWGILSERLLAASSTFPQRHDVLQHAVSIRSNILSMQERVTPTGPRLGWRSEFNNPASLINTETTALSALALGANATWVLEPGYTPLLKDAGNYFMRPHHALSAVVGLSSPGYMVHGPSWNLQPGTYDVDFSLRTPVNNINVPLATVDVYDGSTLLASTVVPTANMPWNNEWLRQRLTVTVTNPTNSTEFRVYWHGNVNLDVGSIRIVKR